MVQSSEGGTIIDCRPLLLTVCAGNVGEYRSDSASKVYLSSDGGYTWKVREDGVCVFCYNGMFVCVGCWTACGQLCVWDSRLWQYHRHST